MFKAVFLLILFIALFSGKPADHDFHVSRSEINYETGTGDIQIAVHVFWDDLESAVTKSGKPALNLFSPSEIRDADLHLEKYLLSRIAVAAGDHAVTPELLGKELSKDRLAVWCYLEIQGQKNVKSLKITNKLLTELYNDQKNIVDFTIDNKKKQILVLDSKTINGVLAIK